MLAIHPTLQDTYAMRLLLARRAASARGRASKRQHVDTRLGGQRESGESASRGWCACRCTCKLRRASQCRSARQREGGGARAGWAPQSTRQREHSLASQAHMRGGLESGKVTPAPPTTPPHVRCPHQALAPTRNRHSRTFRAREQYTEEPYRGEVTPLV